MAHTPGPWTVQGQAVLSDRPYPEWKQIAEVRIGNSGNWSDPEGEANARLIAAAPELHEACKHALHALNTAPRFRCGKFNSYDIASMLEHAIAKAEGKE